MKKRHKNSFRTENIHSESTSSFSSSLKEFINHLHQINKDAKKRGFKDLTIGFEEEWGYYDEHWTNMVINGKRAVSVKNFIEGKQQCIKAK